MPSVDHLMQEYPPEFSRAIYNLPSLGGFDCDLKTLVDIVCGLADIPVQLKQKRIFKVKSIEN